MAFSLPRYNAPDFSEERFLRAPNVRTARAEKDGIAPEGYHATSIFPEYFKLDGQWLLADESRMDSAVVLQNGALQVPELRNIKSGDLVIIGRSEDASEGIYMHSGAFGDARAAADSFAFRTGRSRETAFSVDYDNLYELLRYERGHGNIVWVMGPACAFDADARRSMQALADNGFVHGLLAGNALATHDLEASFLGTALGQNIYTQKTVHNGHYNHLDLINTVRRCGSIPRFIEEYAIHDGIICSIVKNAIPYALTGSIRDDGPLPEVVGDVYEGQMRMRDIIRKATTVICMATQLHTIASGNMTPCFRLVGGVVRPLYIYTVDISEFAVNKLADRGSVSAISMVTNVQDFVVNVAKNVIPG
ncbi:MAG: hypothetical protein LBT21_07395 [Oscillospiraceae bacterium]|jgi:lysine-ketoglutarate reductase/saccharopine dehydrogenase-like protein (TIGR00300 family)|nr:hypothetical protein [Oscillospiraceae bacterium]